MNLLQRMGIGIGIGLLGIVGAKADTTDKDCQAVVKKYETDLRGNMWGSWGALDHFKPSRAMKAEYKEAAHTVSRFSGEYSNCHGGPLANEVLEAMVLNLFSPDPEVAKTMRTRLEIEGFLDLTKQLKDAVAVGIKVDSEISKNLADYATAEFPERKKIREDVNLQRRYLVAVRASAVDSIDRALFFREQPGEFLGLDEKVAEGGVLSNKTHRDTVGLIAGIASGDGRLMSEKYAHWKQDQRELYKNFSLVIEKGLNEGMESLKEDLYWTTIEYTPPKGGKRIYGYASKHFSEIWGQKGDLVYSQIEILDKLIGKDTTFPEVKFEARGARGKVIPEVKVKGTKGKIVPEVKTKEGGAKSAFNHGSCLDISSLDVTSRANQYFQTDLVYSANFNGGELEFGSQNKSKPYDHLFDHFKNKYGEPTRVQGSGGVRIAQWKLANCFYRIGQEATKKGKVRLKVVVKTPPCENSNLLKGTNEQVLEYFGLSGFPVEKSDFNLTFSSSNPSALYSELSKKLIDKFGEPKSSTTFSHGEKLSGWGSRCAPYSLLEQKNNVLLGINERVFGGF